MDAEGITSYITSLFGQVNVPAGQSTCVYTTYLIESSSYISYSEDVHAINTHRAWIIEQLGALIRSGTIPKNDEWVQSILDWLVIHGLFTIRKKSEKSPFIAVSYFII